MQERYLGDVHDFFKFNFLEFISRKLKRKVGLNWYLAKPELIGDSELKKNDGEKRKYLGLPEFTGINSSLAKEFGIFEKIKERKIDKLSKNPKFNKIIKFYETSIPLNNREIWFNKSLNFFKNIEIIFLDPDNGISFKEHGKKNIKYLIFKELQEYYLKGKIITFTQFQSFNLPYLKYIKKVMKSLNERGIESNYPILRNRTGPNTFYITISKRQDNEYKSIIEDYSKNFKRVELIKL